MVLRDERISLKAKGVMALVMSLPPDWDFTIRGLIAVVKEGRDSIYSAIKELKTFGYCEVVACRDERGKLLGNDYIFYEEPQLADSQQPHPYTEKPDTDNPDTENPTQINKDIKEENKETKKETSDDNDEYSFDTFWDLYDKKVGKDKAKRLYDKLSREDRMAVIQYIPRYKKAQPDKQYRKNPETFLRNRSWEDEIVAGHGGTTQLPLGFNIDNNTEKYDNDIKGW